MNSNLALLLFFAFLVIFMGFLWSMAVEIMRPVWIQRKREALCDHAFEKFTQDTGNGLIIETRFCPKCAAVRTLGYGVVVGEVKKAPPKAQPTPQPQRARR